MKSDKLIEKLIKELRIFLKPLSDIMDLEFPLGAISYFSSLGINFNNISNDNYEETDSQFIEYLNSVNSVLKEFNSIFNDKDINELKVNELILLIRTVFHRLEDLHTLTPYINEKSIDDVYDLVISNLVYQYLQGKNIIILELFEFLGLIDYGKSKFLFKWKNFHEVIEGDLNFFKTFYLWGTTKFEHTYFFTNLYSVIKSVKRNTYFLHSFDKQLEILEYDYNLNEGRNSIGEQLMIPIINYSQGEKRYETGISILPYTKKNGISEIGIFLYGTSNLEKEIEFDNNWRFSFYSSITSTDDIGLIINPDNITIKSINNRDIPNLDVEFGIDKTLAIKEECSLLNIAGSSLLMKGYAIKLKGEFNDGVFEPIIEAKFKGLRFVLQNGSEDGFLSKIIPANGVETEFDLTVGWAKSKGFYFGTATALEISIPLNTKDSKHFELKSIDLLIKGKENNGVLFQAATGGSVDFGPFHAFVDKVGVKAKFSFPQDGTANLGLFDADIGFKKPEGIGLEIKAKNITGSGYLSINDDSYIGMLSLNAKAIELTAIGILNTKLPNNKPGYSLLVSISTIFNPAIQLGMGFTLNGVGGLLGVNRTFDIEAMRKKLASGAINSIMFPEDPIKNIDRIISDLQLVFPAIENHCVIAPFLQLAWGGSISFDVGVLMEFPFKDRIVLLGSLKLVLPPVDSRLVINVDVLGDFNFAEKYIRVEGVLRDSHINNNIPLKGGFAFFTSWGNSPQFLFSVGGYHPRYRKPAQFPAVARVGSVIQYKDVLTLTVELYTAITSNSFQIGFRADCNVKFKGIKAEGYLGFDVLIYFNPFRFEADIVMGVSIKYKKWNLAGAALSFRLSGPGPWNASGDVEFRIVGLTIKDDFNFSWGRRSVEPPPPVLEPEELLEDLATSLLEPSNWSAKQPENIQSSEMFRPVEEEENDLLLHPAGYLEIRQKVIPLNKVIEKYGDHIVSGKPSFSLHIDGAENISIIQEYFSRGQFEEMTDEEKISSPDFELMNAGYRFGRDGGDQFEFADDSEWLNVDSLEYEECTLIMEEGEEVLRSSRVANKKVNVEFIPITLTKGRRKQSKKQRKIARNFNRGILNRSRRRHGSKTRELNRKTLVFKEQDEYIIASKGVSSMHADHVKFASYSEAKAYKNQLVGNTSDVELVSLATSKIMQTQF